jgi:uncharacterized repeat protein (TIGR03806 family)
MRATSIPSIVVITASLAACAPDSSSAPLAALDAAPPGPVPASDAAPPAPAPASDAAPPAPAPASDATPPAPAPDATPLDAGRPDPLSPRVENATCRFPALPALGAMQVVEAYPALDFAVPLWAGPAGDAPGRLYVAERGGRIYTFEDRDAVTPRERALFHTVPTQAGGEMGLLGLAFHPDYARNGRLFTYASIAPPHRSRISEWRRDPANPLRVLPESERVLLEVPQPFDNHNGGDLHFGPDGLLYIALGDGGSAGDPQDHGQRTDTLLGSILRIDVDRDDPARGTAYAVPADNPHQEIYAWGLRNPWRMRFDASTGLLWAADVGQNLWEEIDIIRRGGNYGWRKMEGRHCYPPGSACDPSLYDAPLFEYGHDVGESITGGLVYRGVAFPALWGAYVYGDYETGMVWALRPNADYTDAAENAVLADTALSITSFGVDTRGEPLIVAANARASLHRLAPPAAPLPPQAAFPQRLSETGCFDDLAALRPATGVVPYGVQSPFWSDGATKRRFFALPAGATFDYHATDAWQAPVGAVFIKSFALPLPDGGERRLETRFYVRQPTGWQGFTYRWNAEQNDALLLDAALDEPLDPSLHPEGPERWLYPSRAQCDTCHTPAAGFVLGFTTAQLNGPLDYPAGRANQLSALAAAGYVALPAAPDALPRAPAPDDESAPLEARVRAALDMNCSHCHRADANGPTRLDLRAEVPLSETGACDVPPGRGDLGIAGARLIAPGAPERSVLLARMSRRDADGMPPLASTRVDTAGVEQVTRYIQSLQGCAPSP